MGQGRVSSLTVEAARCLVDREGIYARMATNARAKAAKTDTEGAMTMTEEAGVGVTTGAAGGGVQKMRW